MATWPLDTLSCSCSEQASWSKGQLSGDRNAGCSHQRETAHTCKGLGREKRGPANTKGCGDSCVGKKGLETEPWMEVSPGQEGTHRHGQAPSCKRCGQQGGKRGCLALAGEERALAPLQSSAVTGPPAWETPSSPPQRRVG